MVTLYLYHKCTLCLLLAILTRYCSGSRCLATTQYCNCSKMPLWQCKLQGCVEAVRMAVGDAPFDTMLLPNCELYGTIPRELGNMKLMMLNLSHNQLTGTIPKFLGETMSQAPQNLYACMLAHMPKSQHNRRKQFTPTTQQNPG